MNKLKPFREILASLDSDVEAAEDNYYAIWSKFVTASRELQDIRAKREALRTMLAEYEAAIRLKGEIDGDA